MHGVSLRHIFASKEKRMKRMFFTAVLFLAALSVFGQSGEGTLDGAIQNAAQRIQDNLNKGVRIVVYQFQSHNPRISNYVLNELFDKLVNSNKFIVLDRTAQEVVNAELDFQFNKSAGMISDESLASLTKRIGAQAIVTGSLDDAGSDYRFRIRVIGTDTIAAVVSYTVSVNKKDKRITGISGRNPSTTGQKIGTGALNILLGLGSYIERDVAGGITITAGYAVAAGLFVIEATALDWDSPAVGVPATIGVTVAGLTLVYGFARPFIYNHSPQLASVMDNTQFKIVQLPDSGGRAAAFQVSYLFKF
jgi:hypothetical protein